MLDEAENGAAAIKVIEVALGLNHCRLHKLKRSPDIPYMMEDALKDLASLPVPGTKRWMASRKGAVVAAVSNGLLSAEEACARYDLSPEEFALWQRAVEKVGLKGLRTTRIQQYPHLYKSAEISIRGAERHDSAPLDGAPRRRVLA